MAPIPMIAARMLAIPVGPTLDLVG